MMEAGEIAIEHSAAIEHVDAPTDVEWAAFEADRDRVAARVLDVYPMSAIRALVAEGQLGLFEIRVEGERVGSQAIERFEKDGKEYINIVWLAVEPGRFTPRLRFAVRKSWADLRDALGIRRFVIQGRPGWEHVLIAQGITPKELSRTWAFDGKDL